MARSQMLYATDFGSATTAASDGYTYTPQELTAGEMQAGIGGPTSGTGQNSWFTNDPDQNSATATSGASVGGSNYVGNTGFFTGYSAYVGGAQRSTTAASDVVPGAATTYLYHSFTVPTSAQAYQFNVDFAVTASSGSFATQDNFAFTLRNAAGTPLLSINFATTSTSGNSAAGRDQLGYTVGNGTTNIDPNNNGILLNDLYHLTIQVNVTADTFSASLSNGTVIATNISLAGQIVPTSVTEAAATWTLNSSTPDQAGAYEGAGNNVLVFDNYGVTIPEPSTYAMMGAGFVGMIGLLKFRRRRA